MTKLKKKKYQDFLILISKINISDEDIDITIKLLKSIENWDYILSESDNMSINSLLYKHLSNPKLINICPSNYLKHYKSLYKKQFIRNLKTYGHIQKILGHMNNNNIDIALIKGSFLANWLYKDIALRPMNDIDLLCNLKDSNVIVDRMKELGYIQNNIHQSELHAEICTRIKHLPPFYHSSGQKVEIHLDIFSGFEFEFDLMKEVWQNASKVNSEFGYFYLLSHEDHLINLILHLYKHLMSDIQGVTLFWFCDIHEYITYNNKDINWDSLCSKINVLNAQKQFGTILYVLQKYWKTQFPNFVLNSFENKYYKINKRKIFKKKKNIFKYYMQLLSGMFLLNNYKKSLLYLIRLIFPSKSYLISRYNIKNNYYVFFYYIIHPLFITGRFFKRLL